MPIIFEYGGDRISSSACAISKRFPKIKCFLGCVPMSSEQTIYFSDNTVTRMTHLGMLQEWLFWQQDGASRWHLLYENKRPFVIVGLVVMVKTVVLFCWPLRSRGIMPCSSFIYSFTKNVLILPVSYAISICYCWNKELY